MKLTLNRENISRDFVIFEAKKDEGNYWRSLIPDAAVQECKALSVLYRTGSTCYILYRREEADQACLKRKLEDYEDSIKIREIDLSERPLGETVLVQLLFNAIPNLVSDGDMYHNLTGALYYMEPAWMKTKGFHVLEFSMDWDYCIKMSVRSFCKVKDKKNPSTEPRYLVDSESNMLRRVLRNDPDKKKTQYEKRSSEPDKRNNVTFLDFRSLKEFDQCRVGILRKFLKDVEDYLSEYLTMEREQIQEYAEQGGHKSPECMNRLRVLLKDKAVFLENTTEDKGLGDTLVDAIKRHYQIEVQHGTPKAGDILLRIVHEKSCYEDHPEQDPYGKAPANCVVQHLTAENFSAEDRKNKEESPCLRKVIQELGIKLDLLEGRLQFYDWGAVGYDKPMSFVTKYKPGKGPFPLFFDRLTISPDGSLHFDSWEDNIAEGQAEDHRKIRAAFERRTEKKSWIDPDIEGLVYEDPDHIQIIRDTNMVTLPDFDEVYSRLRATMDGEKLDLDPLRQIVQEVLSAHDPKDTRKQQELWVWLKGQGAKATRKEIKGRLGLRSNLDKQIVQSYYDKTGKWINLPMKDKDGKEKMFRGILNIHSFQLDGRSYYCSGYFQDGIQSKMERACLIREVAAVNGLPQTERYLPLMSVDFVRASAWTVVPFPFKYLREWREQRNK